MLKSSLLAILLTAVTTSSTRAITCFAGEDQMSVEGVEGVFCVAGAPCIATFSTGACPPTQEGLPYGSYCGLVASGVYGCKTNTEPTTQVPTPEPTTEAPTPEPTTEVPAATEEPTPETPTPEPTIEEEPAATEPASTEPPMEIPSPAPLASFTTCSTESIRVSVQGLENSYCVDEPVCVQQVSDGNCPAPQDGLEFGSYCELLNTDAYGCKPYTAENVPTNVTYVAPFDCTRNPAGEAVVSIMNAERDYCAPEPVCSGSISGNCPKIQEGLLQDSECFVIDTGVYGCVFMAST